MGSLLETKSRQPLSLWCSIGLFLEGFLRGVVPSFHNFMEPTEMSHAKHNAAQSAVEMIPESGAIGLGSGSTVAIFAEKLGRKIASGDCDISVVPSSYQAYQLAIQHKIPLTNLDSDPDLIMTVDGADEVDRNLNLIKGGGGALFQEKIVADASQQLIIIVDESKMVDRLGSRFPVPVEILPFSLGLVMKRFKAMNIEAAVRMAQKKMGPVVTDNGNFLVDLKFQEPINDPLRISVDIKMIPGVVETGLFVGMADEVHVGKDDGVHIIKK